MGIELIISVLIIIVLIISNILLFIFMKKALNTSFILESKLTILETWMNNFKEMIKDTYSRLKKIDNSGIFERDDSVGVVFQDMVDIMSECNSKINSYNNDNINKSNDSEEQFTTNSKSPIFTREDEERIRQYVSNKERKK